MGKHPTGQMDDSRNGSNHDEQILEQGKRIRALHEIISRPDLTFDEQIDETLRLGCAILGTEIGKVGRQDPENNVSEFLNTIVLSELPAKRGIVLPLDKTFCQVTFSSPEAIAISHVSDSDYKDHPAAEFLGMQSYIGCSINVHGKKFGTINFSNRAPVEVPFTEADKDLVNLMGSWISVMMERQLESEELKKSKETAELANKAKSVFLANMSHEIRTPLTAIIGYSDIALGHSQTEEQRVAALKTIRGSGRHLLHLINDILDFSKIEAGELNVEKVPTTIPNIIQDVSSIISGQAKIKGLYFDIAYIFPVPKCIKTDPLRLKQILLNLCSNAIKFTNLGGIEINISFDEKENSLSFKVIDTGIGLSTDQIEKIFEPYKQADASTSRKYGGTGLGLSLSTRLAGLLGGNLTATSKRDVGSTFNFTLMLDKESIDDSTQYLNSYSDCLTESETEFFDQVTGNILVADDESFNQDLVGMYLEDMGATISFADNGEEAVQEALKGNYDLIYMDMQMPVLSGVEAVVKLRKANYQGPIAMLSANATLEDRKICEEAGSNDFVTKPIDSEKLYDVTARYLLPKRTD